MPRIYSSCNDPLDFCLRCWVSEATAKKRYSTWGDGPDNRGNCFDYNADHPDYEGTGYTCTTCGRKLSSKDNYNV